MTQQVKLPGSPAALVPVLLWCMDAVYIPFGIPEGYGGPRQNLFTPPAPERRVHTTLPCAPLCLSHPGSLLRDDLFLLGHDLRLVLLDPGRHNLCSGLGGYTRGLHGDSWAFVRFSSAATCRVWSGAFHGWSTGCYPFAWLCGTFLDGRVMMVISCTLARRYIYCTILCRMLMGGMISAHGT